MAKIATRITSVSVPVSDQTRALAFYVDVLGFEVRADEKLPSGAPWLEVAPPGADVSIALLAPEDGIPVGVRMGTEDADAAHARLTQAGAAVGSEVLRFDWAPPMFAFSDPDGN